MKDLEVMIEILDTLFNILGNYMAVNLILFGSTTSLYYERKVYG
jgi:hypothetical protein